MIDDIIRRLREAIAAAQDRGPWKADQWEPGGPVVIMSDDFEHDVTLRVIGDFEDDAQHIAYAQSIAVLLNAASPDNIAAVLERLDKAERERERLRADAERLDSGLIRLVDRDEFGEPVATVYSQVDLRAAIDAATAAEQSDKRREG